MMKFNKWTALVLLVFVVSGCETTGTVREDSGNLAALEALHQPAKDAIKVDVEANAGGVYHDGDPIRFKITSAKAGNLYIVSVNSENKAELLFPQGEGSENTLEAGKEYLFPPRDSKNNLYASKPLGRTALAFIVTAGDAQLDDILSLKGGNLHNISFGSDTQWGVKKLSISVEK